LLALAAFYLWTLKLGARASGAAHTGFATLGFIFYELLGILGLGPSRLALRENGLHALGPYVCPVAVGVLAALSLCIAGFARLRKKITPPNIIFYGIAVGLPCVVVITGVEAAHMRLLGRHFMPLLPFFLAFQAVGLSWLLFEGAIRLRLLGIATIVLMLISALEIRFAPRHERDDYRTATATARDAINAGKRLWWIADPTSGRYYKLPTNTTSLTTFDRLIGANLEELPQPDVVIFSKPDLFDPAGDIGVYLLRHNFKVAKVLPAFQIFAPPADRVQSQ
jgi:hypothetical protein